MAALSYRSLIALAYALVGVAISTLAFAADVATLQAKYSELSQRFVAENPGLRPPAPPSGEVLFIASDEYSPAPPMDASSRAARVKYADALFELAKAAAAAGQSSLAFQWTTEAVHENPDHAEARRVLGYTQRGKQWLTPYGVRMLDAGKAWDPQKGWVSTDLKSTPVPDARIDSARHADIKNGWQVRTDHFAVTTNHSLAAGVELAAQLERLYQIWRQLFAGFYYSEKEVSGLFAGERIARVPARQFKVFYYRNRTEYVNNLSRRQPKIGETLGIYFDANAEAHFFAGTIDGKEKPAGDAKATNAPVATMYHEAVHQLFKESKPSARRIGDTANYWVVEGVATYFETLTEHDDPKTGLYFTIGESTAGRLPAAKEKLADSYYIPLADLTKLGQYDIQHRDDVAKLYSQSSGLAAFLLNGRDGQFREPLVRYLQAVYAHRDNDQTLSETTGSSYSELDAAYHRFMGSLP